MPPDDGERSSFGHGGESSGVLCFSFGVNDIGSDARSDWLFMGEASGQTTSLKSHSLVMVVGRILERFA